MRVWDIHFYTSLANVTYLGYDRFMQVFVYSIDRGGWVGILCSISVRNEWIFLQEGDMYLSFLTSLMVHTHPLHVCGVSNHVSTLSIYSHY